MKRYSANTDGGSAAAGDCDAPSKRRALLAQEKTAIVLEGGQAKPEEVRPQSPAPRCEAKRETLTARVPTGSALAAGNVL